MPSKCDHCGELAIEDEEQACSSCGIVVDDITFVQDINHFVKTRPFYSPPRRPKIRISNKPKPRVALNHGLSALKNLCHTFGIPANYESELTDMLNQIYPNKKFHHKDDVAVLAGCCLFLLQRRNNQPIPLIKICHHLGCTRKKFSSLLNFLKSWLNKNNPNFLQGPPDEEVGMFSNCQRREEITDPDIPEAAMSLIPTICEKALEDEKLKLIQKTTELLKLAHSCWLYTGRSPHSVVVACVYLCWKSMHPSRRKASFVKFCSLMQVHDSVAKLRILEIKDLLLKLGSKIPSFTENYVNENNVLFHLDRILQNSETLRNDLLGDEYLAEKIDCQEYNEFRHPPREGPREPPVSAQSSDPDMLDSEAEISDSEIDSYILDSAALQKREEMCKSQSAENRLSLIQ